MDRQETEPLYVTVAEAAQIAGIGEKAMRAFMDGSDPPPYLRIGTKRLVQRAALGWYLETKQEVRRWTEKERRGTGATATAHKTTRQV